MELRAITKSIEEMGEEIELPNGGANDTDDDVVENSQIWAELWEDA